MDRFVEHLRSMGFMVPLGGRWVDVMLKDGHRVALFNVTQTDEFRFGWIEIPNGRKDYTDWAAFKEGLAPFARAMKTAVN